MDIFSLPAVLRRKLRRELLNDLLNGKEEKADGQKQSNVKKVRMVYDYGEEIDDPSVNIFLFCFFRYFISISFV